MKKYLSFICKKILYVVVISVITSLISGCYVSDPENYETNSQTEEILSTASDNTEIIQNAPPVTDVPVETPVQIDKISESAAKWIERYKGLGYDGDKVLMSFDEIKNFNLDTAKRSDALVDIFTIPQNLNGKDIISKIESVGYPSLPKYDHEDNEITQSNLDEILENRNISALGDERVNVKLGIIVQRAALRSLPTDTPFFSDPGKQYYDRLQETEVVVGSGVWVLHESKNGAYCFVQTFNYSGWVASKDIAITSDVTEWNAFASPERFAVVNDSLYITKESYTKLDMGVKLPLADVSYEGYKVKIPGRNPDGTLYYDYITLGGDIACEGYLPYTMNNFYKQAFKYEGAIYGWGGSYDSVDCSGFVSAVMRVFGFELPRNVSQQKNIVGEVIRVEGTGRENVEKVLDGINVPAAVYKPGHVMLYLGKYDGSYYVIHSPEGGRVVCEEILDTSATNIMSINKF